METPPDWPFEDPPNVAVIATPDVMDGSGWIAFVSHDDEDGCWQFHGPGESDPGQAKVVALHRVLAIDPGIAGLADLPFGWQAWRASPSAPWQRAAL